MSTGPQSPTTLDAVDDGWGDVLGSSDEPIKPAESGMAPIVPMTARPEPAASASASALLPPPPTVEPSDSTTAPAIAPPNPFGARAPASPTPVFSPIARPSPTPSIVSAGKPKPTRLSGVPSPLFDPTTGPDEDEIEDEVEEADEGVDAAVAEAPADAAEPDQPATSPRPAPRPPSEVNTLPGPTPPPREVAKLVAESSVVSNPARPAPVVQKAGPPWVAIAAGVVAVLGLGIVLASGDGDGDPEPDAPAPVTAAINSDAEPSVPPLPAAVETRREMPAPADDPVEAGPATAEPPEPSGEGMEPEPADAVPPAPPGPLAPPSAPADGGPAPVDTAPPGSASSEAASALAAGQTRRAHELASVLFEGARDNEAMRIMVLASCQEVEGGRARSEYRKLVGKDVRKDVQRRCHELGVTVTLPDREDTAGELQRRGALRLAAGEHQAAYDLGRASNRKDRNPDAVMLMGRAACKLGDPKKARFSAAMLRPDLRANLTEECKADGIDLDAGS